MPDDGDGAARPDTAQGGSRAKNPLGDVQNLLGFLLAGFGAILSFLGLRSDEVTTVLRNDPGQASVVALVLLLGVLAAVLTVAYTGPGRVTPLFTGGIFLLILGLGAFTDYLIPVGSGRPLSGLILGYAGLCLGAVTAALGGPLRRNVLGASIALLLLLGTGAIVVRFTPVNRMAAPGLMLAGLIAGCVLAGLGLLACLYLALGKGMRAARVQRRRARARARAARADESEAWAEETVARAVEAAARAAASAAQAEETAAGPRQKKRAAEQTAVAEATLAAAQGRTARAVAAGAAARARAARAQEQVRASYRRHHWQLAQRVPLTVVLILTSVMLIAISAYGGMRLESRSQLSFSSQVGSTLTMSGSTATVSVQVAATRLEQSSWVYYVVYGVPAGTHLDEMCTRYVVPGQLPSVLTSNRSLLAQGDLSHCATDPCLYFAIEGSDHQQGWPVLCDILLNGTLNPNATGDVDETLSVPFTVTRYEDVAVRAEVCQPSRCAGSEDGENSRLDWVISPPT